MSSTVCQSHKFQFIEQNKLTPTESVGVISLLSAYQICSSVGATIGRPRAFIERPYKTKSNFLMRKSLFIVAFLYYRNLLESTSPFLIVQI